MKPRYLTTSLAAALILLTPIQAREDNITQSRPYLAELHPTGPIGVPRVATFPVIEFGPDRGVDINSFKVSVAPISNSPNRFRVTVSFGVSGKQGGKMTNFKKMTVRIMSGEAVVATVGPWDWGNVCHVDTPYTYQAVIEAALPYTDLTHAELPPLTCWLTGC